MPHQLNVKIDDDLNSTCFTIRDMSYYFSKIPVDNPVLEVTAPTSAYPVIFTDISEDFNKTLTVNDLHLNANGMYPLPALPDGPYYIRYSVAPNLEVYIAYYYFRVVKLLTKYLEVVSEVLRTRPYMTSTQYDRKIKTLLWYKELIDCAKYMSEENHQNEGANEIYCEVDELLNNFHKCIEC